MQRRSGLLALSLVCFAASALADETMLKSPLERFSTQALAATEGKEAPDFRRHVVPLLGKQGCNSRACHGSFQGQGGFRLSLFGYDFEMDHGGLKDRIDLEAPDDSYALQKATLKEPHRGGKRLDEGSWEYNILRQWIQHGGKTVDPDTTPKFVRLEVTPSELRFNQDGQNDQLRAIAVWSDGAREDVTCLCRFQTNDEQIAEVTSSGNVTSHQAGDTHVVVFYDNGVVPVPVIRPVSSQVGDNYPLVETNTRIDELVVQKLKKLGVVPSPTATDAEFLRRVSLDITGTLPSPQEIRAFVADKSGDKRARKIDELLARPAYAAWWATRFSDWTGNSDDQLNNAATMRGKGGQEWYDWLRVRLEKNASYDDIVEGLVMATGRENGETYRDYCAKLSEIYRRKEGTDGPIYSERETMQHFWARTNFRQPEDRVVAFSYTFLGIRIQCAQCHKHPFDQWTQVDFHQFKNLFAHTRANGQDRKEYDAMLAELKFDRQGKNQNQIQNELIKLLNEGKDIPFQEVVTTKPRPDRRQTGVRKDANGSPTYPSHQARLLGGSEMLDLSQFEDPRQPLMDWLRSKDNPLFAKAFVNRVWANYFNVGIVSPTDDMSLANPPSNAALLDYLASEFIAHDFDIKWLHREICSSDTYQRSWVPNETNRSDERNFSHAVPRRLPAEVAYDAVIMATVSDAEFSRMQQELTVPAGSPAGDRYRSIAIASAGPRQNNTGNRFALSVFGRSIRESNCDCDRSDETSLLQTVFLQNDDQVYRLIDQRNTSWLSQVTRELEPPRSERSNDGDRSVASLRRRVQAAEQQLEQARNSGSGKQTRRAEEALKDARRQLSKASPQPEQPEEKVAVSTEKLTEIISGTYLRTLSREPSPEELQKSLAYISESESPVSGVRDLLWALINTKEFIVNH